MLEFIKWVWGRGNGGEVIGWLECCSCRSIKHSSPLLPRIWYSYHCRCLTATFLQDETGGVGTRQVVFRETMKQRVGTTSRLHLQSSRDLDYRLKILPCWCLTLPVLLFHFVLVHRGLPILYPSFGISREGTRGRIWYSADVAQRNRFNLRKATHHILCHSLHRIFLVWIFLETPER